MRQFLRSGCLTSCQLVVDSEGVKPEAYDKLAACRTAARRISHSPIGQLTSVSLWFGLRAGAITSSISSTFSFAIFESRLLALSPS
jgi:hypothetical protein